VLFLSTSNTIRTDRGGLRSFLPLTKPNIWHFGVINGTAETSFSALARASPTHVIQAAYSNCLFSLRLVTGGIVGVCRVRH
jgi:hypothetical protein